MINLDKLDIYLLKANAYDLQDNSEEIIKNLTSEMSLLQILTLANTISADYSFSEKIEYIKNLIQQINKYDNSFSLSEETIKLYCYYFSSNIYLKELYEDKTDSLIEELENICLIQTNNDIEEFMVVTIKYKLLELYTRDIQRFYDKMKNLLKDLESNKNHNQEIKEVFATMTKVINE